MLNLKDAGLATVVLLRTMSLDVYLASRSDRAGGASTGIVWVLSSMMGSLTGSGVDTRTYIAPCTAVQWFLLQSTSLKLENAP